MSVPLGKVVHLELHTSDLARACAFYYGVCGWRPHKVDAGNGSYLALEMGDFGGGVVVCDTTRPLWLPYVEVAEIRDATGRAKELGAAVLLQPREGPAGWRSVIATPTAGEVALWQAKEHRRR